MYKVQWKMLKTKYNSDSDRIASKSIKLTQKLEETDCKMFTYKQLQCLNYMFIYDDDIIDFQYFYQLEINLFSDAD